MLDLSYNVSATLNESDCEIGIVAVVVVVVAGVGKRHVEFYMATGSRLSFFFVLSVYEIGITLCR